MTITGQVVTLDPIAFLASAGKAKAGMVHSISGYIQGVQVKL